MLDVCGSFITDIIYNILHDSAISMHEKTGVGLSQAYRGTLDSYIASSNTPKFYSDMLTNLFHFVRHSTVFNTLSYTECISMYASFFVPSMYVTSMTSDQKLNILTMVLGNTLREFVVKVKSEYIGFIIDNHNDPANIEILQDAILEILLNQRSQSYDRFIQSQKTTIVTPAKPPAKAINQKSILKLSTAFKKSIARKNCLEKKNAALVKKNEQLVEMIGELKKMLLLQIAGQKEQNKVIEELKRQLVVNPVEQQPPKMVDGNDSMGIDDSDFMLTTEYVN
jgi:hypothetical protein